MAVVEVTTIAIVVELLINIDKGLRDRDRTQYGVPGCSLLALEAVGTLETASPMSFPVTWVTCVYFLLPSLKPNRTCVTLSGVLARGLASVAAM